VNNQVGWISLLANNLAGSILDLTLASSNPQGCGEKYMYRFVLLSFLLKHFLSGRAPLSFGDRPKRLESCQSLTGFGAHDIYACQGFPVLTRPPPVTARGDGRHDRNLANSQATGTERTILICERRDRRRSNGQNISGALVNPLMRLKVQGLRMSGLMMLSYLFRYLDKSHAFIRAIQ